MSDPVNTPGVADHKATGSTDAEKGYTPVFNNTVRTIAYVAGLIAVAVGLGFTQFGDPTVGDYITTVGGLIAGGFGVAYNPLRMAGK